MRRDPTPEPTAGVAAKSATSAASRSHHQQGFGERSQSSLPARDRHANGFATAEAGIRNWNRNTGLCTGRLSAGESQSFAKEPLRAPVLRAGCTPRNTGVVGSERGRLARAVARDPRLYHSFYCRAAVRKPIPRPGPRIFCGRYDGRTDHRPFKDQCLAGDIAYFGDALQGHQQDTAGDRSSTECGWSGRRFCHALGEPCTNYRPVDPRTVRPASMG